MLRSLLLVSLALCLHSAFAQQQCPVLYKGNGLLFGGVGSQCVKGCRSRSAEVARLCGFRGPNDDVWGLCSPQQRESNLRVAKTLGGGAAFNLSPCELEKYLRGRTTWIMGDSFMKQTFRSIQCFLFDFWNHQECEPHSDPATVQQLYKLPAQPSQSKCFNLAGPQGGRVCFVHVVLGSSLLGNNEVAGGGVLPLLRTKFAQPQDIFVVNFGWWHRKRPEWWTTFEPALHALGKDYQANRAKWPHLLFKEIPTVHLGDEKQGVCLPASGGPQKLDLTNPRFNTNVVTRDILKQYGIPVFSEFQVTTPLHDNHIGPKNSPKLDCLHYCHPGVPEMGLWFLYESLKSGQSGIKPLPATTKQINKCVPSTTAGWKV